MTDLDTFTKLYLTWTEQKSDSSDASYAQGRDDAFHEAAEALRSAITPNKSEQADPEGDRFHAARPAFSQVGILQIASDGDSVTMSTANFEKLGDILWTYHALTNSPELPELL